MARVDNDQAGMPPAPHRSAQSAPPDAVVWQAAWRFAPPGGPLTVSPYGSGNVNATFLVTPAATLSPPFILQRLNPAVFPEPQLIMSNLRVLTSHLEGRRPQPVIPPGRRWELPRLIPTRDGADFWLDANGACWRALSLIPAAHTRDTIRDDHHAWEVGAALGRFHLLVSDLSPHTLADTLPGFHVTPSYLQRYDVVRQQTAVPDDPAAAFARDFIEQRRSWAGVLEEARRRGVLTLRVIHGDPKVNNILLDNVTGQAVGLIDLDTVKPGLSHYDLGDCLRSGANPLGEETTAWDRVSFDLRLGQAILQGYLAEARPFLTAADYDYLYDSIRLIAFELGLRFFTDYLAGNVYFRSRHPRHNLWRAVVQFRLTASIEAQETQLRRLIAELR
ncbi:MAG: phosphotransferase enzyme family protein [Desulfobacca sp.]|uniref:phosphotransferase enzyme family protein n=1 Tax=Desulfobacca sp. TaxID=2067990 RepID=UPI00404B47CA